MAAITVNNGLQRIGVQAFQATGTGVTYNVARYIRTMSLDDSSVAFAAAHTALNSGGAVSNEYDAAFDSTPTRSGQAITCIMTAPTGSANFTIRRLAEHDDTAANVTTSSTTLCAGVDGQTLAKTSDFTLQTTKIFTFSSV